MRHKALLGAAGIVLAAGLAALLLTLGDTSHTVQYSQTLTRTEANPAETPVDANHFQTPTKQPFRLDIPSHGISAALQKVGVDQFGAVTAPNNVHVAGWFVNSAVPGRKGLSIIDGHVDGVSQQGVFHNLQSVTKGDVVTVSLGDGTKASYTVFKTQSVEVDAVDTYLFDQDPTVSGQLNMITCAGTYQRTQREYEKRLIVSAKLNQAH